MHQPTFHSPDYEEHHTVFSVNGVAHIANFSKAYSVEEHTRRYDTRVSNDQIDIIVKRHLHDRCTDREFHDREKKEKRKEKRKKKRKKGRKEGRKEGTK